MSERKEAFAALLAAKLLSQLAPFKYWGIYCPQHDCWLRFPDSALIYYPSPLIAQAHLEGEIKSSFGGAHLWEVTEFGEQQAFPNAALCSDPIVLCLWKETF